MVYKPQNCILAKSFRCIKIIFLLIWPFILGMQAAFRGFQVRRQYRKILWSVGVLEKAVLRWRLKRKGFRGLHVKSEEVIEDQNNCSDSVEEFYKISQKQAVERVERAVVTVQAMFRSKKAQVEYRRMKMAHSEATVSDFLVPCEKQLFIMQLRLKKIVFLTCSSNTNASTSLIRTWILEALPREKLVYPVA